MSQRGMIIAGIVLLLLAIGILGRFAHHLQLKNRAKRNAESQ
jgi:hypothetical protein